MVKDFDPNIGKDTQFKPGQSGNPNGVPKGTLHLSTIIQQLAEEINWELTQLTNKDELTKQYGKNGFKAMVYVAFTKAMDGDVKAMEFLAKHGYGEKLVIALEDPAAEALKKLGLIDDGETKGSAEETS